MNTFYKAEIVKITTLPLYFTKTNDSLPLYFTKINDSLPLYFFNHEKYITFATDNQFVKK